MTEKEKMLAGEPYDATDPQLVAERRRARELLYGLNALARRAAGAADGRHPRLLGAAGEGVWIEPPFHCDYGATSTWATASTSTSTA